MRKMHRQLFGMKLFLVSLLLLAAVIVGCSSTSSPATPFTLAHPALTITSTSLPDGRVGVEYCGVFVMATGGALPYKWSSPTAGSGALPEGLALCTEESVLGPERIISGLPQKAGTSTVSLTVTDKTGDVATQNLSITINPQLVTEDQAVKIASSNLPTDVAAKATVSTKYLPSYSKTEGLWYVFFDNTNVLRTQLNWPVDEQGRQPQIGPEDVLNTAVIIIDGNTGGIFGRIAANNPAFSFPGPPGPCGCSLPTNGPNP